MTQLRRLSGASRLLERLVELPDLPTTVRALPAPAFASLVRKVGIEDAGEIVALATTEQLVTAFDEDLFVGAPGERETFDARRFLRWLEALRETGEDVAARRLTELSEDFVVHALDALVLVLDHDALRDRMQEDPDDEDADRADDALASALTEEIDGYLLVARDPEAWDAILGVVLALDREHRAVLVRLLDRCVRLSSELVDDLAALSEVLTEAASLAEDVEAEREDRRSAAGFVEARAARAFLSLARSGAEPAERDAGTRAYFRSASKQPVAATGAEAAAEAATVLAWLAEADEAQPKRRTQRALPSSRSFPIAEALSALSQRASSAFDARMEELAYLANVLIAGAKGPRGRYRPAEAAEAALATVALGAALALVERSSAQPTVETLAVLFETERADLAFRRASAALTSFGVGVEGVLLERMAVPAALATLAEKRR